jgi:predicted nucleic acid-binding protein
MEIYGFAFQNPEEKQLVDEFFENVEIIETDKLIADIVVNFRNTTKKKIKPPDAIIFATAKYLGADLLTDDWDDFEEIDPKVVIKNIDPYKK